VALKYLGGQTPVSEQILRIPGGGMFPFKVTSTLEIIYGTELLTLE